MGVQTVEPRARGLRDRTDDLAPTVALSPGALLALRAFAVADDGVTVDQVAAALGLETVRVLERVQQAADAGVPIVDDGDGHVRLPDSLRAGLRGSVLPSLMTAWRARFAAADPRHAVSAPEGAAGAMDTPRTSMVTVATPRATLEDDPHVNRELPRTHASQGPHAAALSALVSRSPEPGHASRPPPGQTPATPREAEAAFASGDVESTVSRLLEAARASARTGAGEQAAQQVHSALAVLAEAPDNDARRLTRIAALIELGTVEARLTGPSPEFTLTRAVDTLRAALEMLAPDDPPALRVQLVTALSDALVDIGSEAALGDALNILAKSTRALAERGFAREASRLLDDAAVVQMRLGSFVAAQKLLAQARETFDAPRDGDVESITEAAAIEHRSARLALHAPHVPGTERQALVTAARHARGAEAMFTQVGDDRERARVTETLGRIELRLGNADAAAELLWRALDVQEALGDAIGLARTTEALAETLAVAGRFPEAIAVLSDSITLNLEKASPVGIAFDRHVLRAITLRAGSEVSGASVSAIVRRLETAESLLGRIEPASLRRPIVPARASMPPVA